MDEDVLDAAAAAAAAELAPTVARLGVYGLTLDDFLLPAVRAAVAVLVEHHEDDCSQRAAAQLLDLSEQVAAAVAQRDNALAQLQIVQGQIEQQAGELLAAQADTLNAATRAGVLAQALADIEALPYEGPEPSARRIARESLI